MSNTIPDRTQKTKPELTAERARELFDYDQDTGELRWKVARHVSRQGLAAGTRHYKGYLVVNVDGTMQIVHRVVWIMVHGGWPEYHIKHANGDRLDNRLSNLSDEQPTAYGDTLSIERVASLLSYDPGSGVFVWVGGKRRGRVAGCRVPSGYVTIGIDGKSYYASRLAWFISTGAWPEKHIDHINGNRSDNRRSNLRDVDCSTNNENQRKAHTRNKSSGMLGVSKTGCRWKSKIHSHGRDYHLGTFDTPEEAHATYLAAKRQMHPGCTI